MALADALANGAFVLERAAYQKLVEKAGGSDKVKAEDLLKTKVCMLVFKDYDSKEFKVGDQRFRIHVAQKERRVIYSIFRIIEKSPELGSASPPPTGNPPAKETYETLECVGELTQSNIPKKDWEKDTFVVLWNVDNYLPS
jgi:hypothetical protein